MTWSYDNTTPTDRDKVRLLIGDTDTNDQQMQDEEIDYLLTKQTDPVLAAALAAEAIGAKYSRKSDMSIGALSISSSQRATAFFALADRLRAQVSQQALYLVRMRVGGLSVSGKEALSADADAVQGAFSIGQDDYTPPPGSPGEG